MKRKIYNKLVEWKEKSEGKNAILIDGARRVGKSYIAEEFAKENYKSYIIIDFNKVGDDIKKLFDNYLDNLDTLFIYLKGYYNVELYEKNSLIIFDEVQLCPRARTAIKYLVADGRYDYIETGSLISINENVKDILIPSEEKTLRMYPMDFEEFLWAMGEENLMSFITDSYNKKKPLEQLMHRKIMDYFRQYLIVGGMPQAVETYLEDKNFEKTDETKRNILNLYKNDIKKYAKDPIKVERIFNEIPSQLQNEEKRFRMSTIEDGARFRDYQDAFYWLKDAMLVNITEDTNEPNIGLNFQKNPNKFKCYLLDTGLLLSLAFNEKEIVDEGIYKKILFDKLSFNEGMLMENIVAQMLVASGNELYFYYNYDKDNSDENMEIDFLIRKNKITSKHNISPIEVKSGKNYTFNSLNKFRAKYKDYISTSYLIHQDDFKEKDNIEFIPIYMTPLLG